MCETEERQENLDKTKTGFSSTKIYSFVVPTRSASFFLKLPLPFTC